jgi:cell wall-associated NlpC family hydrolase
LQKSIASLLLAFVIITPALADDTMTLDLPAFNSTMPGVDARKEYNKTTSSTDAFSRSEKSSAANTQKTETLQAPDRRGGLRRTPPDKILGHLGMTVGITPLRLQPTSHCHPAAKIASGTYLILKDTRPGWCGILLEDKRIGWIPEKYVQVLDYEIVDTHMGEATTPTKSAINNNSLLTASQKAVLEAAYSYLGVAYKWGGTSANGIDCSGFVQRCFASEGIELPRTAHEQINCGMPVPTDKLEPADRLYFASRSGQIVHTGIYLGNGYFIHSSSSRHGVAISRLSDPMYRRMYAGARR